ncbi:MAG: class I SAM-dependent DNA methyltransferase [Candidatus Nanoarchaeia archaeon]
MKFQRLYKDLAPYYDLVYEKKEYKKEAEEIHKLIQKHKKTKGKELLEVACGSGRYLEHLKKKYKVTGLDLNKDMLKIARKKCPGVPLVQGNMISFDLKKEFDVVCCLFSSIGYAKTYSGLKKAVKTLTDHLKSGGVVVIEPFLTRKDWVNGKPHANFIDKPDVKIVRMNVAKSRGNVAILDFNYLIATKKGIEHLTDRHELGLFDTGRIIEILRDNGICAKEFPGPKKSTRVRIVGVK